VRNLPQAAGWRCACCPLTALALLRDSRVEGAYTCYLVARAIIAAVAVRLINSREGGSGLAKWAILSSRTEMPQGIAYRATLARAVSVSMCSRIAI
jgi:hypothetical protein